MIPSSTPIIIINSKHQSSSSPTIIIATNFVINFSLHFISLHSNVISHYILPHYKAAAAAAFIYDPVLTTIIIIINKHQSSHHQRSSSPPTLSLISNFIRCPFKNGLHITKRLLLLLLFLVLKITLVLMRFPFSVGLGASLLCLTRACIYVHLLVCLFIYYNEYLHIYWCTTCFLLNYRYLYLHMYWCITCFLLDYHPPLRVLTSSLLICSFVSFVCSSVHLFVC
jgi:hypothetical protein